MGTRAVLVTADGEQRRDLWISADGRTRPRAASRRHVVGRDEALLAAGSARTLVVGTGCLGRVEVSPRAREALAAHGIRLVAAPTPEAVECYNATTGPRGAIFHVAC
jgi:hypothetical protein